MLICAVGFVLSKLDLKSKLELDSIKSQNIFCDFLTDLGAHTY